MVAHKKATIFLNLYCYYIIRLKSNTNFSNFNTSPIGTPNLP